MFVGVAVGVFVGVLVAVGVCVGVFVAVAVGVFVAVSRSWSIGWRRRGCGVASGRASVASRLVRPNVYRTDESRKSSLIAFQRHHCRRINRKSIISGIDRRTAVEQCMRQGIAAVVGKRPEERIDIQKIRGYPTGASVRVPNKVIAV